MSRRFVKLSTRLLLASMVPLAITLGLDLYLIARLITHEQVPSVAIAALAMFVFVVLWGILPRLRWMQKLLEN